MRIIAALLSLIFLSTLFGCEEHQRYEQPVQRQMEVNVQVNDSHLMNAEEFDLETVVARMRNGDLQDAESIQRFINEPAINNIDIDDDGNVDELTLQEVQGGDGVTFAVNAHPTTGEPVVVAELSFKQNISTGTVEVSGGYPEYVRGHQHHYYHHTMTGSVIGDMMFYSWLFSPSRVVYRPVYHRGMYYSTPRGVMSRSQIHSTRTTYRTEHKISPVKKAAKPSTYKPQSTAAQKTASKWTQQKKAAAPKSGNLSGLSSKKGQTSSFEKSQASKTQKATGFSTPKPKAAPPKSSWPKPSSKPSFSSPKPRPSFSKPSFKRR